ncbi:MAG: GyrI-like domain-containing protein [Chitinispirillaceae bacterium]
MVSQFEVTELSQKPAVSISTKCPVQKLPQVMSEAFGKMQTYLDEIGEQPDGPPYILYFNEDMQNLDVEIGLPVRKALRGYNEIESNYTLGGSAASCLYQGPYNELETAYAQLAEFLQKEGLTPKGIACEVYINDPGDTAPQNLLTKVMFALA